MSGLPQFRRFGDGNCFFGSLNAGQPHGPGRIYVEATGETVSEVVDDVISSNSGRWDNGKLNGRGMQLFPNGDRYEGLFKDHLFEGLGVCTWKDGSIYEGEWSQGKRAGLGALWDSQGKLDECGQRTDGKFVDSCAVPMRLIPQGKLLSAAGQFACTFTAMRCVRHCTIDCSLCHSLSCLLCVMCSSTSEARSSERLRAASEGLILRRPTE